MIPLAPHSKGPLWWSQKIRGVQILFPKGFSLCKCNSFNTPSLHIVISPQAQRICFEILPNIELSPRHGCHGGHSISSFPPPNMVTGFMNSTFHYGLQTRLKLLCPGTTKGLNQLSWFIIGQGWYTSRPWMPWVDTFLLHHHVYSVSGIMAVYIFHKKIFANIPSLLNVGPSSFVLFSCFTWANNIVTHIFFIGSEITRVL